jgi:TRAP-type C4-dicarboxylate transport system permease small subunit
MMNVVPRDRRLFARRIIASICVLFWGYSGYIGFSLVSEVARRTSHVNAGQWDLYVLFPVGMTLLGIGLVAISRRVPTAAYMGLLIIEILPILPFLVMYGGGM